MGRRVRASVYLVHPLQVEAVGWVASLNTVTAGTLAAAAIYLYVRAAQTTERRRANVLFIASCAVFLLALLAKPSVVGLPLAAMAIDRWLIARSWRTVLTRVAVWVLIAVPIVVAGRIAQRSAFVERVDPPRRLLVAGDAAGFYLTKLVAPFSLGIDYARTPQAVFADGGTAATNFTVAAVAAALLVAQRRRRPWLAVGGLIFLAGIAPVLGLVPFDFQTFSTVADRYVYAGMFGPALVVAFVFSEAAARRLKIAVGAIIVVALAGLTFAQACAWRSDASLVAQSLSANPSSPVADYIGGVVAHAAAEAATKPTERAEQIQSAFEHYNQALRVRPRYARAWLALANLYHFAGRSPDALAAYQRAADSGYTAEPRLWIHWGIALFEAGRREDAPRRLPPSDRARPALRRRACRFWALPSCKWADPKTAACRFAAPWRSSRITLPPGRV